VPQEVRDGVEVPAVELVVQCAREHDADEVGGEDGRDDELGRQLLETCSYEGRFGRIRHNRRIWVSQGTPQTMCASTNTAKNNALLTNKIDGLVGFADRIVVVP